jgi:hypothetical protein
MEQIHHLPNLLILAVTVTLFGGAAFTAPFIGRRLARRADASAHDASVFDGFLAVMAMAGVVLAFSLVQVDANLRADQEHVGREAAAIVMADRTLQRIGLPEAGAVRVLLSDFVRGQVRDEWPRLADQKRDARTDARYAALVRAAGALEPQSRRQEVIFAELVKAVDEISDARETLLEDAALQLPPIFWIVSACFVALGLVLATLSEASIPRAAALGVTAAGIGLLFSFVLIVDAPFGGGSGLKPAEIEKALALGTRQAAARANIN